MQELGFRGSGSYFVEDNPITSGLSLALAPVKPSDSGYIMKEAPVSAKALVLVRLTLLTFQKENGPF